MLIQLARIVAYQVSYFCVALVVLLANWLYCSEVFWPVFVAVMALYAAGLYKILNGREQTHKRTKLIACDPTVASGALADNRDVCRRWVA